MSVGIGTSSTPFAYSILWYPLGGFLANSENPNSTMSRISVT